MPRPEGFRTIFGFSLKPLNQMEFGLCTEAGGGGGDAPFACQINEVGKDIACGGADEVFWQLGIDAAGQRVGAGRASCKAARISVSRIWRCETSQSSRPAGSSIGAPWPE